MYSMCCYQCVLSIDFTWTNPKDRCCTLCWSPDDGLQRSPLLFDDIWGNKWRKKDSSKVTAPLLLQHSSSPPLISPLLLCLLLLSWQTLSVLDYTQMIPGGAASGPAIRQAEAHVVSCTASLSHILYSISCRGRTYTLSFSDWFCFTSSYFIFLFTKCLIIEQRRKGKP